MQCAIQATCFNYSIDVFATFLCIARTDAHIGMSEAGFFSQSSS
jgi:hypothetical protein